ncbi:MAG: PilN domain-containing protein [candidate division KSB1 bacterium]|nr:PilN domain-containing protein [candidate division KSB1 bacterium]
MNINFIDILGHRKFSGLDISHHAVSYSELSMDRNKNWRLIKVAREAIRYERSHDDKEALISALGRLRNSLEKDSIEVITNLNGTSVRNSLIQTPVLDYQSTSEWLDVNIERFIPAHVDLNDINFSFQILSESEQDQTILLSIAKKKDVNRHRELLKENGFDVLSVSAGVTDIINTLVFSGIAHERSIIIAYLDYHKMTMILFKKGYILKYHEIGLANPYSILNTEQSESPGTSRPISQCVSSLRNFIESLISENDIVGGEYNVLLRGAKDYASAVSEELEKYSISTENNDDVTHEPEEHHVGPEFTLATGLALKGLYPLLNTINLSEPEDHNEISVADEKERILRLIIYLGSGFLGVIIIMTLLTGILQRWYENGLNSVLMQSSQLAALQKLKSENARLTADIRKSKTIIHNRSHIARLLNESGRLIPANCWLREMQVHHSSDDAHQMDVTFTGISFSEIDVAELIRALRTSSVAENVKLLYTEKVNARDVRLKTKRFGQNLVKYQLSFTLKNNS